MNGNQVTLSERTVAWVSVVFRKAIAKSPEPRLLQEVGVLSASYLASNTFTH
ncbi:MAG: hypothetical protein F6J92_36985 [Symploca sp. SIO1A3]|nr:hypothetical protein [Symploca sp. SIO1A3]